MPYTIKPNKYQKAIRLYETMPEEKANRHLREAFQAKELSPSDFDLGKLFVECFGWGAFQACRQDKSNLATDVMEAAGGVTTAAFGNISGQIVFNTVLDAYQNEEFVFSKLIPTKSTPFNGERIPGISHIGDEALVVEEAMPFPLAGVSEIYLDTPPTKKRGMLVPVTREAVFFDRTGLLLDRCSQVGYWLGVNKEKRAIDCVIDENAGAVSAMLGGHRYHFLGNSIATYGDSSGTHNWDNLVATNALLNWIQLDAAEQALNEILDPFTQEPILLEATHLIVTKGLEQTASYILNATMIRRTTPGFPDTGNPIETEFQNPFRSKYQLATSRLLGSRLGTDTTWFLGDPTKAFVYMENWPLQVKQAPSNSHDEFHRDIVQQYRADERGAYYTMEPRIMVKNTVA